MATQGRRYSIDLAEKLKKEPYRFGFFQAIRLLTLLRKGKDGNAAKIPANLRFRTVPSLAFPASEITAFRELPSPVSPDEEPLQELEVAFFGLTGPSGILPTPYTELIMDRRSHFRDDALHTFLDMFSHRGLALFAEAWQKYRFYLNYETGKRDGFSRHLLELTGRMAKTSTLGDVLPDSLTAFFAGHLSCRVMPPSNFANMVTEAVGAPVELEQFVGQWISVPPGEQTQLGMGACALGRDSLVGDRVWDCQTKVRLRIGPLKPDRFKLFLPGGKAAKLLALMVKNCLGTTLRCDVTLILDPEGTPPKAARA